MNNNFRNIGFSQYDNNGINIAKKNITSKNNNIYTINCFPEKEEYFLVLMKHTRPHDPCAAEYQWVIEAKVNAFKMHLTYQTVV